jgi:hypothetical protein
VNIAVKSPNAKTVAGDTVNTGVKNHTAKTVERDNANTTSERHDARIVARNTASTVVVCHGVKIVKCDFCNNKHKLHLVPLLYLWRKIYFACALFLKYSRKGYSMHVLKIH